jgi:hypothetical protein
VGLRHTYFSAAAFNPLPWLERLTHPYVHQAGVPLRGAQLTVRWTGRAERALRRRTAPLNVQMQLYFSCVVVKRVLFPEAPPADAMDLQGRIRVAFHVVESEACDPETYAAQHPQRRLLDSPGAGRMRPRELLLDFRRSRWEGEMRLTG